MAPIKQNLEFSTGQLRIAFCGKLPPLQRLHFVDHPYLLPSQRDDRRSSGDCGKRRIAMKIIASTLVALSILVGIAAPVSAFDGSTFWAEKSRTSY